MFSETDKKVLQVGLVAAVIVGLALLYYVWAVVKYKVSGYEKTINTTQAQITQKQAELDNLNDWKARENEIRGYIERLRKEVDRLPTKPEAREFFGILQSSLSMTNLSENQIIRQKNVPMGAYEEIPYQIVCRARYHDLGQFLALVEQHKLQIMRIKTLDILNDLRRPSQHQVTLRVATFIFTEPVPQMDRKEVASK